MQGWKSSPYWYEKDHKEAPESDRSHFDHEGMVTLLTVTDGSARNRILFFKPAQESLVHHDDHTNGLNLAKVVSDDDENVPEPPPFTSILKN